MKLRDLNCKGHTARARRNIVEDYMTIGFSEDKILDTEVPSTVDGITSELDMRIFRLAKKVNGISKDE